MSSLIFLLTALAVFGVDADDHGGSHYKTVYTNETIYPIDDIWRMESDRMMFTYMVSFPQMMNNVTLMLFKYQDGMDMMSLKYWPCPTLHMGTPWHIVLSSKTEGCKMEHDRIKCYGNPTYWGMTGEKIFFVLKRCANKGLMGTVFELMKEGPMVSGAGTTAPLLAVPLLGLVAAITAVLY